MKIRKMARQIRKKLIFYIILLVIAVVAASFIPAFNFFTDMLEQEQKRNATQGVKGLQTILEEYREQAEHLAAVASESPQLAQVLEQRKDGVMQTLASQMCETAGVDFVVFMDDQGRVLAHTRGKPEILAKVQTSDDVKAALAGKLRGVITADDAVRLAIRASAPVRDVRGQLVGVVSLGYDATKNRIVDRTKQLFSTEATIFLGDERVSTTICKEGERVVGTKLDPHIMIDVLEEGNFHLGRAGILGTEYMTAYLPLTVAEGETLGVLFAGESLDDFLAVRNKAILVAGFILLCFLIGLIFVTATRLQQRQEAAKAALEKMVLSRTKELRESEARYRAVVEGQTDCIYHCSPEGQLTFVNEAFCRYYGVRKTAVLGMRLDSVPGMQMAVFEEIYSRLTFQQSAEILQMQYVKQDGSIRWIEYITRAVFDQAGKVKEYQGVGRDITAQKEAEVALGQAREAMERASRVITLAVIGGGIAHEIKQPLNAIKILAETALLRQTQVQNKNSEILIADIRNILGQVDKVDAIVNQLRALSSSNQKIEVVSCDLNQAVDKALLAIGGQLSFHRIRLEKELEPELPLVGSLPVRLEEVILNLLINAVQAVEGLPKEQRRIRVRTWSDQLVWLEVADDGPGISQELCDQILEPLFTTKQPAEGMGMGMAIVKAMVEASQGMLQVGNNLEGGACIRVSFPPFSSH